MHLMERIPITDWTKLSAEEKLTKVTNIRSLRESCRREAMLVPTKSAIKNKAKAGTKAKRVPKPKTPDITKLLAKLSPAQLESLKQSYGVTQ